MIPNELGVVEVLGSMGAFGTAVDCYKVGMG